MRIPATGLMNTENASAANAAAPTHAFESVIS